MDPSVTFHTNQALELADLFGLKFARERLGSPPRKLRVSEPDGPSTDGGRKARQSIMLVPETGEGASVMLGFVDAGKKTAEIRSYPLLKQQFEARHQQPFGVDEEEYGKLLGAMRTFFDAQKVTLELVEAVPPRPQANVSMPAALSPKTIADIAPPSNIVPISLSFIAGIGVGFLLCWMWMFAKG